MPQAISKRRTFGASGSNAWIFQCPEEAYTSWLELIGRGRGGWMVKKYKKQVREGDLVYIWVSGKNAGIRALTEIEASPLEDVGEILFSTPRQPGEHWVGLAPLEILDEPVWRKDLKVDPRLENLEILKFAAGSTFRVREEERAVIDEYIAQVMGESEAVGSSSAGMAGEVGEPAVPAFGFPDREGTASSVGFGGDVRLVEAVAGVVSTRLWIDPPLIRPEPGFVDDTFPEAYVLDYRDLGEADFFIRTSETQVEVGLILDGASMGVKKQKHPIEMFADQVWDHINLIYEDEAISELRWGFEGTPSADRGFSLGFSKGLASWYFAPGQQWVCVRMEVPPGSADSKLVDRLARVLIALDCLSFRDGDRLTLTPPTPVSVFVSYSHENFAWVKEELLPQLRSAAGPSIDFWWDERLSPVVEWSAEVKAQLDDCNAAMLVVSNASLRPDRFTWDKEVPLLRNRRKKDGIPFVGVLAEEVGFDGMGQLEDAGIGLVNADKGKPGQPVFPIGVHKWNTATVQALLTRST